MGWIAHHNEGRLATFACLLVLLLAGPAGNAQPDLPPATGKDRVLEALARRGDLTLRDTNLESALFTISELWGVNIVAGAIEGSVNGVFKDAPLKDILDSILQSNGYAYRAIGESLIISPVRDLGQINPFFISETIPVGVAEVEEVVEAASVLSTPNGQIRALPSAGAVLVVDFPERVEKIRQLVSQLDEATRRLAAPGTPGVGPRELEVAYFRTHYIEAQRAADALQVVLSADGRVASVEAEDRMLVVDYAENVRMVQAVLARLDRPRPQVNIRSLIYDISLADAEQIGINWDGITNGSIGADGTVSAQQSGLRFLTQTASPLDTSGTGGAFTFYTLEGNLDIQAVVVALQQADDSRLLADPNVTVMDNEKANVQSISEIPFQQLTETAAGGNIGTTAFKEVGVKLDVTPKIARDGTIDLTVVPEFSRLAGFTEDTAQPIIEKRQATTRVRVNNGQTVVIAGLRQRADVGGFDGIPLLKDVRFLGHLFRARDTQITESELVVFVTPTIVGYSDPLSQRDRLTAETVNARLDHIPAAEGGVGCDPEAPCDCQPTLPPAANPSELLPPELELTPVEPNATSNKATPELQYASSPRRLPPTETRLATVHETIPPAPSPERPLRVDYDSRFRATGGISAVDQRTEERTAPKPPPEAVESEKDRRSWKDRLFWR